MSDRRDKFTWEPADLELVRAAPTRAVEPQQISSATSERILREVIRGITVPEESKQESDFRRELEASVEEIRRKGGIVEIPSEIP